MRFLLFGAFPFSFLMNRQGNLGVKINSNRSDYSFIIS